MPLSKRKRSAEKSVLMASHLHILKVTFISICIHCYGLTTKWSISCSIGYCHIANRHLFPAKKGCKRSESSSFWAIFHCIESSVIIFNYGFINSLSGKRDISFFTEYLFPENSTSNMDHSTLFIWYCLYRLCYGGIITIFFFYSYLKHFNSP